MEIDIYAGKRVLYKDANGGGWQIGEIALEPAIVNKKGVWLSIIPRDLIDKEADRVHIAEINNIFTEAIKVEEWMRSSLLTKEEYINIIKSEDFEPNLEQAWVSDGEYFYYPVSKYNENWIMKQPFDYIIRGA